MKRLTTGIFHYRFAALFLFVALCSGLMFPSYGFARENRQVALEEAYRSALDHNEHISASRHRVRQAEEDVRIARSPMLPQVQLQGRSIRMKESPENPFTRTGGLDGYNEARVQASQVLFAGGKLKIGYRASRHVAESIRLEDYRTRQEILYTVSHSFYNVLLARRSVDIAQNRLTRSERHLELARSRQDVGLVDMTAVLRAKVQVAEAMEAIEDARNRYAVSLEQLGLEMGAPRPPASVKEPDTIEWDETTTLAQYMETAFENRADLMAAEKGRLAAQKQVKAEKADFLPSLSLEGSYSRVDEEDIHYGDKYDWQAALVASFPLFTGLKNTAEVARAKARESEQQAAVNRAKQEIRLDVRIAYADIQTRKKQVQFLEDQVESARANYEQISAKFREGLASTVDVVDAQTALNESEIRLATTYYQLQLDHLRLRLAAGIFREDLADVEESG